MGVRVHRFLQIGYFDLMISLYVRHFNGNQEHQISENSSVSGSWCVVYTTRRKCFRGDNVLIVCHLDTQLNSS